MTSARILACAVLAAAVAVAVTALITRDSRAEITGWRSELAGITIHKHVPEPSDVRENMHCPGACGDEIHVFDERQRVKLSDGLVVDHQHTAGACESNLHTNPDENMNGPLTIPANWQISSHYILVDRPGTPTDHKPFAGTITLDQPILGVMATEARLDLSDLRVGGTNTSYPNSNPWMGLENNSPDDEDRFSAGCTGVRNVTFTFYVREFDQIRVITDENDEPTANNDGYPPIIEDSGLGAGAPGVLANDTDPDGDCPDGCPPDQLIAVLNSGPAHAASFGFPGDGSFTYTPSANYCGPDSFTYRARDLPLEKGTQSDVATVSITVNCVNDAPVNAVPGTQTTAEDTPRVFSSGNGNQISVSDVDAGGSAVRVTLTAANGTATLAGTGGLSFSTGDGTADATMTFTGTMASINADMNGMSYTPDLNYNTPASATGPASLAITTNDLGNTGSGGAKQDADTVAISVYPLNDIPTLLGGVAGTTIGVPVEIDMRTRATDIETSVNDLTFTLASGPSHGSISQNGPLWTYTPSPPTFEGQDSFTYSVTDRGDPDNCSPPSASCDQNQTVVTTFTTTSPDTAGDVGDHPSAAVDAAGNPVVSYFSATGANLKLMHCNDPNCAGGDESITSPDTVGQVGSHTSLALDSAGNPVIAYQDAGNLDLRVMHCNDPECAGGDESVVSLDVLTPSGFDNSLELDAAGRPVVSYMQDGEGFLRLLHCGNPACTSGNSILEVDQSGRGGFTSLELDADGNPVISYSETSNSPNQLRLLHCTNPNCAGDEGEEQVVDSGPSIDFTSLELRASGNPVISYRSNDGVNDGLKLASCGNPNCSSGNSIRFLDVGCKPEFAPCGSRGLYTSMGLSPAGNPLVSYYDSWLNRLKLLECFDASCDTGNVIRTFDQGSGPYRPSLTLDAGGNLLIAYYETLNGNLKIRRGMNFSPTAAINITVSGNPPPTAANGAFNTTEDPPTPLAIDLGPLVSDSDTADANLAYLIDQQPAHGTLSGTGQNRTYTPAANFNGTDSFKYHVTDRGKPDNCGVPTPTCARAQSSTVATVTITVAPVNDPPTASNSAVITVEDSPSGVSVDLGGLVSDLETGDANLSYVVDTPPANGTLSGGGELPTYTPNPDFNGADSFEYHVVDRGDPDNCGPPSASCAAALSSAVRTVTITVTPVNDAPSFTKGADQTALEDSGVQTVAAWATALSAGPSDESGQALDFIVSNDNNALFSAQPVVAANGTLTYTPAANANGSATATVQIHDNGGTANGGVDTSLAQTFDMTVCADEDADGLAQAGGPAACDIFQPFDNCPDTANPGQQNNVHPGTTIGDHCEDPEPDGVFDISDNCPDAANAGQQNMVHPGTPAGDHCEDPEPDTVMDFFDNCPDTANAGQENADGDVWGDACETADCIAVPTAWLTPAGDGDCDGFPSTVAAGGRGPEADIGTDPADPCPDDATDDAWPMDFDMNTKVNIIDVLFFGPVLSAEYDSRFDLNANGVVNIIDVLMFGPFIGQSCTNP